MGLDSSGYLMSLVLAVLFADAAHEQPGLAALLQTHELDSVDLVLRAQRLLVRFVSQRDAAVFGQRAGRVCELRALGTQVCGAHGAVHRRGVALVLVTPYDALQETERSSSVFWRLEYSQEPFQEHRNLYAWFLHLLIRNH